MSHLMGRRPLGGRYNTISLPSGNVDCPEITIIRISLIARKALLHIIELPHEIPLSSLGSQEIRNVLQRAMKSGCQPRPALKDYWFMEICNSWYVFYPYTYGIPSLKREFNFLLDAFGQLTGRRKKTTETTIVS